MYNANYNRVDENLMTSLEEQIRNLFNPDFNKGAIDEPSKEDRRFLECVSNFIHFEDE